MKLTITNLKKWLFSFKFLFLVIFIILQVTIIVSMLYIFPYTKEMQQACVSKAYADNPSGSWVGFHCFFHPLWGYYFMLNSPGILVYDFIDQIPAISNNMSKLPHAVQYFIGDMMDPFSILLSGAFYVFIGHLLDKLKVKLFLSKN